jgi:hypothetical protein
VGEKGERGWRRCSRGGRGGEGVERGVLREERGFKGGGEGGICDCDCIPAYCIHSQYAQWEIVRIPVVV